jgi:DNA-directed RNA polymerase specialized sigma24 family protein
VAAEFDRLREGAIRRLLAAIRDNEVGLTQADLERYYFDQAVPRTLEAIRLEYYLIVDVTQDLANRKRRMARFLVCSTGDDGEDPLSRSAEEFMDRVRRGKFPNWDNPRARDKYFETILKRKAWNFVDEARDRRERAGIAKAQNASPGSHVTWTDPTGGEASVWLAQVLGEEVPQKDREALFLHFWRGFTVAEIAEEQGVARSTVYRRFESALRLARERLSGAFEH